MKLNPRSRCYSWRRFERGRPTRMNRTEATPGEIPQLRRCAACNPPHTPGTTVSPAHEHAMPYPGTRAVPSAPEYNICDPACASPAVGYDNPNCCTRAASSTGAKCDILGTGLEISALRWRLTVDEEWCDRVDVLVAIRAIVDPRRSSSLLPAVDPQLIEVSLTLRIIGQRCCIRDGLSRAIQAASPIAQR